jgi:hypothetical protein
LLPGNYPALTGAAQYVHFRYGTVKTINLRNLISIQLGIANCPKNDINYLTAIFDDNFNQEFSAIAQEIYKKKGKATIIVKSGKKTAKVQITVK